MTTRTELIENLGTPRRQLEEGRILFFELRENGRQPEFVREGDPFYGPYSLVVVVEQDRVGRASLVRVWE
ncbi:MAG: hypothetical protein AB7I19_11725 [Planctomycetota bacterium]